MTTRWSHLGLLVPRQRWLLVPYYLLPCAAGLVALLHPSAGVVAASVTLPWLVLIWAGFYVLGGALCTVGVTLKQLWGESLGLPLLASASTIYSTALLLSYPERGGAALVVGLLLMTQALGLLDRWMGVMALLRRARELETE
ncbi:hypothetical protein ACIGG9_16100 [Pseudonocardia alni]|uniref:hypothetical protein n=1 Tax=Pseudonocardia alni TaxID=33907 RepID=UPI0033D2D2B7